MGGPTPLSFRFRGREYPIVGERGLAASLTGSHPPILGRSIRYHRPRAPFCGTGFCSQCLVRVNGVPNTRSCTYRPAAGDRVVSENGVPSVEYDLLGLLDALFPRGLDTLHGFRRPAFLRGFYQRVIRGLAGYGRPPTPGASAPVAPASLLDSDVLVIGAGPAGRAASTRLAAAGRSVRLVDRGPLTAPPTGVASHPRTTVTFLPPPSPDRPFPFEGSAVDERGAARLLRSREVVVSTGAYDGGLLFPGNDRPGVLTAEGAIQLASGRGDAPFERALLVGGEDRAAELIDRFGTHIAAAVSLSTFGPAVARRASELEIPLYPRSLILEARGRRRVRSALVRPRGGGPPLSLPVDAILLAHRRLPNVQLFFQPGAEMEWSGEVGAYLPRLSPGGGTSVPGLFAAGEAAGFAAGAESEASGVAAAEALLASASSAAPALRPPTVGTPSPLEGYYTELLGAASGRGKWILCACEDVLLSEIDEANALGYRGLEEVKRYTGVGTGVCQGRFCLPDAILLLSALERRPPAEVGYIRQRPPVLPTPLGAWAELPEAPP
ncbi:MAG: 2Fe-2S iron-sulfur cluster-binding protein [Thermoplasmata archaeon]|nr:2Fe-2S iron-sulfur cluster-binding protein [Thermoplasmata archaeon]